jgi:F0F1-type ATP synthase assembly protein I
VDDSQRRELTQDMYRSSGSFELVLGSVLLALIGFLLDRWIGITPVLTISLAVLGFAGACVNIYFGYRREMEQHDIDKPWSRQHG